jgi:hypothetical protein
MHKGKTTREDSPVRVEAEVGVLLPQARKHLGPAEAERGREGDMEEQGLLPP